MSQAQSPNNRNSIFGWVKNLKKGNLLSNDSINEISDNEGLSSSDYKTSDIESNSNSNSYHQEFLRPLLHHKSRSTNNVNRVRSNSNSTNHGGGGANLLLPPHGESDASNIRQHRDSFLLNNPLVDKNSKYFGVRLEDAVNQACAKISIFPSDDSVQVLQYGKIPIVVAKCGVYLKNNGLTVEGIFRVGGSSKRLKELQVIFNSPPDFGKKLNWDGYTVHDAASILRRYLNFLPEPLIPLELYETFRDPLRKRIRIINYMKYKANNPKKLLKRPSQSEPAKESESGSKAPQTPIDILKSGDSNNTTTNEIISTTNTSGTETPNKTSGNTPPNDLETPKSAITSGSLPSPSLTPINVTDQIDTQLESSDVPEIAQEVIDDDILNDKDLNNDNEPNTDVNITNTATINDDDTTNTNNNPQTADSNNSTSNEEARNTLAGIKQTKKSKNYRKLTKDVHDAINEYKALLDKLPNLSKQLLFYILDLLAMVQNNSDANLMSSRNLAAIFQPSILSHPSHDLNPTEYALSQFVVEFLVQYAYKLLPNHENLIKSNSHMNLKQLHGKANGMESNNPADAPSSGDNTNLMPTKKFTRHHSKSLSSGNPEDLVGYQNNVNSKSLPVVDNDFELTDDDQSEQDAASSIQNSDLNDDEKPQVEAQDKEEVSGPNIVVSTPSSSSIPKITTTSQ